MRWSIKFSCFCFSYYQREILLLQFPWSQNNFTTLFFVPREMQHPESLSFEASDLRTEQCKFAWRIVADPLNKVIRISPNEAQPFCVYNVMFTKSSLYCNHFILMNHNFFINYNNFFRAIFLYRYCLVSKVLTKVQTFKLFSF